MDQASFPQILVIDDEPLLRELLREVLTDEGFRVTTGNSMVNDIEAVAQLQPQLIILDIIWNGALTGLDFLRRLKTDPRTQHIPIAACTAATHLTAEITGLFTDADCGIISKPFDLDDLIVEIKRCLHCEDRPSPSA